MLNRNDLYVALWCAGLAGIGWIGPAAGDQTRTVTIRNGTGVAFDLAQIRAGPGGTWSGDLLGATVLAPDATVSVSVPSAACELDIRVTTAQGFQYLRHAHDVCAEPTIAFSASDLKLTIEPGGLSLTLDNRTGYPIVYAHVRPAGAADWGPDLLGSTVIGRDRSVTVQTGFGLCDLDLRLIDRDGDEYRLPGVNACGGPIVVSLQHLAREAEAVPGVPMPGLVNRTTEPVFHVFVRPRGSGAWSGERLGLNVLPAAGTGTIPLGDMPCHIDLWAAGRGSVTYRKSDVDICSGADIALLLSDRAAADGATFALRNDTGFMLFFAEARTAGAGEWSGDLLGPITLADGEMRLLERPDAGCRVDVRAVDQDDDRYERRDVDVCAESLLTLTLRDLQRRD